MEIKNIPDKVNVKNKNLAALLFDKDSNKKTSENKNDKFKNLFENNIKKEVKDAVAEKSVNNDKKIEANTKETTQNGKVDLKTVENILKEVLASVSSTEQNVNKNANKKVDEMINENINQKSDENIDKTTGTVNEKDTIEKLIKVLVKGISTPVKSEKTMENTKKTENGDDMIKDILDKIDKILSNDQIQIKIPKTSDEKPVQKSSEQKQALEELIQLVAKMPEQITPGITLAIKDQKKNKELKINNDITSLKIDLKKENQDTNSPKNITDIQDDKKIKTFKYILNELAKNRGETPASNDKINVKSENILTPTLNAATGSLSSQTPTNKHEATSMQELKEMVKSQITDHFNLKISNANKVELHLHTEEYGSLKINFEKKDNGIIEVKIETDQSKTKSHELSGAMNEVKQELKEKGFDIRFDFQDNNSNNKENAREQEKRKEEYTAPKNTDNVDENDESKFSEQFMKVIGGI